MLQKLKSFEKYEFSSVASTLCYVRVAAITLPASQVNFSNVKLLLCLTNTL